MLYFISDNCEKLKTRTAGAILGQHSKFHVVVM